MAQIRDKIYFLIIDVFSKSGWATQTVSCYKRSAFVICCQPSPYNSRRLNYTARKPEISRVFKVFQLMDSLQKPYY
jgi:hypothetical protein